MNNIKNFAIVLLTIALIWALLAKNCRPVKPSIVTKIDTVIARDKAVDQKIVAQDSIIMALTEDNERLRSGLDKSDKYLRTANKTATQLANELADARMRHDTIMYQAVCDSLGNAAIQWELDYRHISDSARWAFGQLDALLKHKDTIISAQEGSRARLLSALNESKLLLSPKRHLYGGISVGSTKISFEYLKVGLYYFDKKGNGYGAGIGPMKTGDLLMEGKYLRQIF